MNSTKTRNDYDQFLYYENLKDKPDRIIVYLHDFLFYPELHDNFCKDLRFFKYYGLYLPYARKTEYDEEVKKETLNLNYYIRYVKDMILSFNSNEVYLIAEGISGPIGLIVSFVLRDIIKKLVLVNPYNSRVSAETIDMLNNLPTNIDECYDFLKKVLGDDSPLLRRGKESEIVINVMRKIYYNYDDLKDYALELTLPKTLETIRVYENESKIETLLIVSENNKFIKPIEQIAAYKNNRYVKVVQLPNDTYLPIVKNEKIYVETILKFLINNIGLNDDKHLPSKDVYKYLSNEWKQYYRYSFADQLSERERKEYLETLDKYEKELANEIQINPYDEQTTNSYVEQQIEAMNQVYNYVKENYKQQKQYEKTSKLDLIPDIQIDYHYQPNKIYQNNQGYYVYHDGKGNGYYKNETGAWKKIIDKN